MTHRLDTAGCIFEIVGPQLHIKDGDRTIGTFELTPSVGDDLLRPGAWDAVTPTHFKADLAADEGSIHLALEHGHVCYWMQTPRPYFDKLSYFRASQPTGQGWQTFVSDEHDRFWEYDLDADVTISSSYVARHPDGHDGKGMLDPGDRPPAWIWNIPVRALAFRTGENWLGLSIPGPLPVGVTRLTMAQRRFTMTFEALRPACDEGQTPRVYFAPKLTGPYDVLDAHRDISQKSGMIRQKTFEQPSWWNQPLYKYWDEFFRRHKSRPGGFVNIPRDSSGREDTDLTTANLLDWTRTVSDSIGLRVNITLEQGAFLRYGEYIPTESLGGTAGLRATIDQLRRHGTHTALFFHLYHVDKQCAFYRQHPECFCQPKPEAPELVQGSPLSADEQLAVIDWTHPRGREYMLGLVDFLVSDRPDCLNADYLAVNNNIGVDPRCHSFHDPDWGIGDLMQFKVQRLVYERARQVKPDCLVRRQSAADCYMQPYADNINCCEDWHSTTDCWYRRHQIVTRLMPQVLLTTDAWFVTLTKGYEYYMALSACMVPEIESVGHAIHPYMIYRPLGEKDYRRRRSGLRVYNNAPLHYSDQCRVTWQPDGRLEAWRRYTRGPLAGFYAALALSPRCLVTYSPRRALVGCSESRFVTVPLPSGVDVDDVQMVPHEGDPQPWPWQASSTDDGPAVEMHVADCGERAMYYQVLFSREHPGDGH